MRSPPDLITLQCAQQEAIEAYFDAQIDNKNKIKMTINEPNFFVHEGKRIYCVDPANIEFVLNKYRERKWKITGTGLWIFEAGQPKE